MSTRQERKHRWWMRCFNCGEWRGSVKGKRTPGHYDPWTKSYICKRKEGTSG